MKLSDIAPGYAQRVIFVGKTGSGKSVLWKSLLGAYSQYKDVVIIDPKNEIHIKGSLRIDNPKRLPSSYSGVIVYCPEPEYDNIDGYNILFKWVYARRETLVVIDELYSVIFNNQFPPYLNALYTRGRGLGISVWGCSQRPRFIPKFCISETERQYLFKLKTHDDRKQMTGVMGDNAIKEVKTFSFLYSTDDMDNPILLTLDKGSGTLKNGEFQ